MEIGTVLSVAGTLFSALQSPVLHEVLSTSDYKSRLEELQDTVNTIKAVLRDAETKQQLSYQDQDFIEKLKYTVFEADDLFDEFVALAELKQLQKADVRLFKKVRDFFSSSKNSVSVAYRMSSGVKDMSKKLKAIADSNQFRFKIDPEPIRKKSRETDSFVNQVDIIGREVDLEKIVDILLGSDDQRGVSVISIVGMGGLGKTALAKLVYNHPRVRDAFPLKKWTCVSDEDQKVLDVKNILAKILGQNQEGSTLEQVQSQVQAELASKKYLLVLDDVWTENRDQWSRLADYLTRGERGSWIVVTTRSKMTAKFTGGEMHELRGLSKQNSWRLFKRVAFGSDQPNPADELATIGREIVDGCRGVPLAITVAGSLLYGQDKNKWLSVQKIGLANVTDDRNDIMPILKLSFDHLETPLKNCFCYCSLFPKDYEMEKEMLIRLWMAQGYIILRHQSETFEDVAEEYFSILTTRYFFQDIKEDKFGEIKFKIHDLIHDIAQNVAGKEFRALDSNSGNVDKHVRHLSISNRSEYEKDYSLGKTHIRSLFFYHYGEANFQSKVEALVGNFTRLRVLDLSRKNIKRLPDSIGDLLHLRYLELSRNLEMDALPNSISKLCNLQTLLLHHCFELKELPKEFSRLAKLRVLDIEYCGKLASMPRGMGKLTCLRMLKGWYRVGEGRCTSWEQWFDGLRDLKTLVNLKDELEIKMWWPDNAKNDVREDGEEGLYLIKMEHLKKITLNFHNNREEDGTIDDDEGVTMKLMESLRPHSNLKSLNVWFYHGVKMPGWVTHLPNLLDLNLYNCEELRYLSSLEKLHRLKSLQLNDLPELEYIEVVEMVSFFPSLEVLDLKNLPNFRGWRRGAGAGMEESRNSSSNQPQPQPRFLQCLPQLKELLITKCPELTCIMVCPKLETLILRKCNIGRWQIVWGTKANEILTEAKIQNNSNNNNNNPEYINSSSCKSSVPNLRKINEEAWLINWKPMESFDSLRKLIICKDDELVELPNWMQYLSALEYLEIESCKNLEAMPDWMPKLTSLQELVINCSESLYKRCQRDPPGEDWPYIQYIPKTKLDY